MELENINNLVFDIGGVLIGYRWEDMLKDYGLNDEEANRIGSIIFNDPIWRDYDRGIIETEALILYYRKMYPQDAEHIEYFIRNCELIKVNRPRVWEIIESLKEIGYKIYLLSNYSEHLLKLHVSDMHLFNKVDGKVISYEVNYIKPEPQIYEALLDKYNLNPAECLFFDDRQDNVDGALKANINAQKVDGEEHLISMLKELIK